MSDSELGELRQAAERELLPMMADTLHCPGCGGETEYFDAGIRRCKDCDGLVGSTTRERATKYVLIDGPMLPDCDDERYFDFQFNHTRHVRGWYNPTTKRVIQYG